MAKRLRDATDPGQRSKRRKNGQDVTDALPAIDPVQQQASVTAYMFHALKLLQKALKRSKTIEIQKLTRKLKLARESKMDAANAVASTSDLEMQLSTLKDLSLDPIAFFLLNTRLPKLVYLQQIIAPLLASLPHSEPLSDLAPNTAEGKNRNRLIANKLTKEAWDEIVRAVGKRMGQAVEDRPIVVKKLLVSKNAMVEEEDDQDDEDEDGQGFTPALPGKRLSKRALRAAKGAANAISNPKARSAALAQLVQPASLSRKISGSDGADGVESNSEEERGDAVDDNGEEYDDVGSDIDDDEVVMREMARLDAGIGSGSESDFESEEEEDVDDLGSAASDVDSASSFPAAKVAAVNPKPSAVNPKPSAVIKSSSKAATLPQQKKKPITSSAFLPSLASGYISYSDSDDEDAQWLKDEEKSDKKERKNRRGQRARQAIWEQKYGSGANHIVKETGAPAAAVKGSKANRGDTHSKKQKRAIDAPPGKGDRYAPFDGSTTRPGAELNPNTQPILARAASKVEKGMHPSWEAKRKATEAAAETLANAPKGKKTVFA